MKRAHIDLPAMLERAGVNLNALLYEEAEAAWNAPLDPRKHKHRIGTQLYSMRMELGCTLNHLSYRTGLHRQLLARIEDYDLAVSYKTVRRIAEAVNLTAEELLSWGCERRSAII